MATKSKRDLNHTKFLQKAEQGRTRAYQNKEVVYSQGSQANSVFYIQSGIVKLTITSERSRRQAVLTLVHAGDFFGEDCLAKQTSRMSTATSIGPSSITRLETAIVRHEIDQEPSFSAVFIRYLLAKNASLKADLADHFFNSCERRLARILLMRPYSVKKPASGPTIRFTQTTLAEMVGTTRARVNLFMSQFRDKGYLRYTDGAYNGSLEIDAKQLTAFLKS
jgi:CRP/FNR family cyclic AMP-dependent transcriptional regulator